MALIEYSLPPEMHEFERHGRFLFYDPVNFIWFQTDRLGKGVVDGLARQGNPRDAAAEVAALAGAPLDEAAVYVEKSIQGLLEIGFLHQGEYVGADWGTGLAEHPYLLYIHLTSRCNLKCPYCYNQEHRFQIRQAPTATREQFEQLIDEAVELGFKGVKLTGGEALLNREALAIARYARQKGLRVNLLTNGTLITDEETAREVVESVTSVSISLDSPDPVEHDSVRGKGSHGKVLRAIRLLQKAGLGHLHINSVITPVNHGSISEMLRYAADEIGASNITLAPTGISVADPQGRWKAARYRLSPDEIEQMYERESDFHRQRRTSLPVISNRSLRRTQCGAGNGVVSVDSNGDLYPCQTMHTPEFRCGNVFETSLREVLAGSGLLARIKNLTVDHIEECRTCAMRYICVSGCRMEAYSREGRLDARSGDLCSVFYRIALDHLWESATLPAGQRTAALTDDLEKLELC